MGGPTDTVGSATSDSTPTVGNTLEDTLAAFATQIDARTPIPTPTPGFVDRSLEQFAERTGWSDFTFLGLSEADWFNVGISILLFLAGYWVVMRLLNRMLLHLAQRTKTTFDDEFLHVIGQDIRRLVGVLLLRLAVLRLDFIGNPLRTWIADIFFVLILVLSVIISLKLVNFAAEWYTKLILQKQAKDEQHLDAIVTLLQHVSYAFIIVTGILIALVHFGIKINLLSSILLIVGLAVVIGARTILSDLASGFIILVDQPFRVGDAITVEGWPDYAFVEKIGTRATHVRTLDYRRAIIPNSKTISSQLINHSHPDTTMRVETRVRVAYRTDLARIRELISDAVRGIDGVLPDKPVEILYREFGDSTRLMLVRWWIADFDQEYYIVDAVNSAIEMALNEAGFAIPFTTLDLNLNQIVVPQQTTSGSQSATVDRDSSSNL
jgi:small-conductance mechanosensitive channel